jgi:KDO2-lipid IV(A) lauroyltransferase
VTQPPVATRWYSHGWNRPLSWELVLRITPRLPRFVLVPLHHVTTLICLICMPAERAAARRNLRRVTGARGLASLRVSYRLFHNFSRFMVAYGEMRDSRLTDLHGRLIDAEPTEADVRRLLDEGRGIVLATMHLGQWDLGLKLLARFDVPVHVVMRPEDAREVTRYADEARSWAGLEVHHAGDSRLLAVQLMLALKRGEIVAIQLDRPFGDNVMRTSFFGAKTDLPTGPVQLAMATGAPLLPVFVLLDRGNLYRLLALPPLRFERGAGVDADAGAREGTRRVVEAMETVVSRYPDQWFNFYDVWPETGGGPSS